jgi:HrpA-like RNA helicase
MALVAKKFALTAHQLLAARAEVEQLREATAELNAQRFAFERQIAKLLNLYIDAVKDTGTGGTLTGMKSAVLRETFRLAPFKADAPVKPGRPTSAVEKAKTVRTPTRPLPALALRNDFEDAVRSGAKVIIVEGATGSGKSTQLPQYLEAMFPKDAGMIVCSEPRKLAAVSYLIN